MTSITRWKPFSALDTFTSEPRDGFVSLRNAMDRLFEEAFIRPSQLLPSWAAGDGGMTPPSLDLYETEDEVVVKAALAGVRPEDVDVSVEGRLLTLKGQLRAENRTERAGYHLRELRHGSFYRRIQLPVAVEVEKAEARFENGVLTLRLPKAAEARERKIEITAGSGASAKESQAGKAA
jgi:HSP20 family protein